MISKEIDASCLEDYYVQLYELHSDAHGEQYMLVHNEIKSLMEECHSYTEFGINQGATLACALLTKPTVVRAYDITLDWYRRAEELFNAYAEENQINYRVQERDSLSVKIQPVDLLYIDTRHIYRQLIKELNLHAKYVNKYIVCHDTTTGNRLDEAIEEFVSENEEWTIEKICRESVGYTTIKRK